MNLIIFTKYIPKSQVTFYYINQIFNWHCFAQYLMVITELFFFNVQSKGDKEKEEVSKPSAAEGEDTHVFSRMQGTVKMYDR